MTATYFTLVPGLSPCPERTHWGFLPTAKVSSHSPSRQPEQLLFAAPKRSKPPAGRPFTGDSFRVVACGSGVRWESGPVVARYLRPLLVRSRGAGGRARESAGLRPTVGAHPAPKKSSEIGQAL